MSVLEYDAAKHLAFEREEGKAEGRAESHIAIIMKKVQKSKSLEVIADEIRHLYEAVMECGAACSVAEVFEKAMKCS